MHLISSPHRQEEMLPCCWCSLKSHHSPVGSCLEVSACLRQGEPQNGPAVQVQHMSGSFLQPPGSSLGKSSCTYMVQLPKRTWSLRLTMLPCSIPFGFRWCTITCSVPPLPFSSWPHQPLFSLMPMSHFSLKPTHSPHRCRALLSTPSVQARRQPPIPYPRC